MQLRDMSREEPSGNCRGNIKCQDLTPSAHDLARRSVVVPSHLDTTFTAVGRQSQSELPLPAELL